MQTCDLIGLLEFKKWQREFSQDLNDELINSLWNGSLMARVWSTPWMMTAISPSPYANKKTTVSWFLWGTGVGWMGLGSYVQASAVARFISGRQCCRHRGIDINLKYASSLCSCHYSYGNVSSDIWHGKSEEHHLRSTHSPTSPYLWGVCCSLWWSHHEGNQGFYW